MYVHVYTDAPRGRGAAGGPYRGWRRRFAALAAALGGLLSVAAFGVVPAAADQYTGMLAPGTIGVGGASSASGGFVYGSYSWTAPSGTNFDGFAYTSAAFSVISDNSVGGVSVGFGGDGTANQPSILFPWTDDCSITNSGHEWTRNLTVAGLSGKQTCSTSGNTSGWNYTNAEIDNTSPGTNPQAEYHTLWFTAFCQAGNCNYDTSDEWGSGSGSVANLSANIDDPNNQPGGSAYWTVNNGSSWYQTDSSSPTINVNAADPAGVCAIGAWLTGPGSYYVQLTNASPGMENPGSPVGNEFDSVTPCPGSGSATVSGSAPLAGNLPSGTYSLAIVASNPGNWESGAGLSNAPTIASYGNAINIDDTVPTIRWASTSSNWTSSTSEQFTVTAGPSGVSGVSCTDNGTAVATTHISGSTYSVPTVSQGANAMSCTATNGDANGALRSATAAQTYDVDTTVPTVTFSDIGYTPGTWTNVAQTVTVSATGGPSGIGLLLCEVDGTSAPLVGADANQVRISGDGEHVLDCTATSNTLVTGQSTYDVWVDTRQPTVTFSGAPASPAWLSGTPTVVVIGGEQGGTLSRVTQLVCSVNGGSPITLNVDAAQDYTSSFVLTTNGADVVSCQATDAAGTTGPATSETVNVDNPDAQPAGASLTRYASSPNIDGGADPFTDGPSQTTWYRDPRSVTITANNTGGGAGIASISCTGAELGGGTTGSWPIDSLNADSQGGERVKVTVQPPGGDLACTATDMAGNVYALGSYEFEIDDTAPAGAFVAQSAWPEPEEVELHVTDSGSGVQFVRVYMQPNSDGKAIDLGFAQYHRSTKDYVVDVDDGTVMPGEYTFYVNVADNAGNSGQITASSNGGAEQLQLPLRQDTAVTLQAQSVTGIEDAAAPSVLTPALGATGVTSTSTGKTDARASGPALTASAARAAERHATSCKAAKHGSGKCSQAKAAAALNVPYGNAVRLTGVLRKLKHGDRVIGHARIDVYQEVNGTGKISLLGKTTTNAHGGYSYRVKGGASRVVFAVYPGTEKLRSAVSQLPENFTGSVSLKTNNVEAGGWLGVTGAVEGGHIPAGGVDVTVHYCQVGLPGCGQFGTIRTNTNGEYSFKQYFTAATKGLRYRLWVTVPPGQPGWPYDGATSPKAVELVA